MQKAFVVLYLSKKCFKMSKKRKLGEEPQINFDSPNSKKARKSEDMSLLSESVSGISRSGRVRKKSAKLMEMEDFDNPEAESADPELKKIQNKKSKYSVVSGAGISTVMSTSGLEEEESTEEGEANKKVAPIKICSRPTGSSSSAIKSSSNVLAGLPASGYISDHPLLSVTINKSAIEVKTPKKNKSKESSVTKLLSPSGVKVEKIPFFGDLDQSSPELSPPKTSSKKKKKKSSKSECHGSSLSTLDLLAAGGLSDSLPEIKPKSKSKSKKKSSKHTHSQMILPSLMASDSPDMDVDDDDLADNSELVIAEPLPKLNSGKKKKKKSSHDGGKLNIKLEPEGEFDDVDSNNTMASSTSISHSHSVYLAEKKKVKKQKLTVGKFAGRVKERKKGRPMTAYTLWCREYRPWVVAESPDMDFAAISRRLGEVWQSLPDKEKLSWRRQAKRLSAKSIVNTGNTEQHQKSKLLNKQSKSVFSENESSPHSRDLYKVVGIAPIDVAAHLKLLGESLSIIGQRLTEHEGQIAVSGSLSVLLDSTLCALGPLLCLSADVPEFQGCNNETLGSILDNIAYIMPGIG